MVDRIQKILAKLSAKERGELLSIVENIKQGEISRYDVKKLKGSKNIFRVRWGKFRIIYRLEGELILVLAIERRSDTTYNL